MLASEEREISLAPKNIKLSPDDYLAGEQRSDVKHEYDNGYVVAMVGASRAHNLIALTVASAVKSHVKGEPCRTYISDTKVRIQTRSNDVFYYPDVMVSCDPNPPSEYYEVKPVLIVEVLSPSTEMRDKLEKLSAYCAIPSFIINGNDLFLNLYYGRDTTPNDPDRWRLGDEDRFPYKSKFALFILQNGNTLEFAMRADGAEGINFILDRAMVNTRGFEELLHEYVYTMGY